MSSRFEPALASHRGRTANARGVLSGRLCTLRAFEERDVDRLPETIGRPDVVRWMSHRIPHPYGPDDARAWVDAEATRSPVENFAIDVGGAFAGAVGFRPGAGEFVRTAEFGYWLAPEFWGRGIATDAARTLARLAFADRGMRRLTAWVSRENAASARVLEKSGFAREGTLRSHLTSRDGIVSDAHFYGRLATDPEPP